MKKQLLIFSTLVFMAPFFSHAKSLMEGNWRTEDGAKLIRINEFNGHVTFNTQSYYSNGAVVDWFFEFSLPQGRDAKVGEIIPGRVRSVDGYYSCVFDEGAEAKLQSPGILKVHFVVVTHHRETRTVRDGNRGHHGRRIDWNGWEWVESHYGFPIDRYRVISSECVIDQRNWVTSILTKTNSPFKK